MIEIEGEVGQLQERNRLVFGRFRPYTSACIYLCVCVLRWCTGEEGKEKKEKKKKKRKKEKEKEKKRKRKEKEK